MGKHKYIKKQYGKHWRTLYRKQQIQQFKTYIQDLKDDLRDAKYSFKEYYGKDVESQGGLWPWFLHLLRTSIQSKSKRKINMEKRK